MTITEYTCRSLPSIRISTAPDLHKGTDSNSAPVERGLSSSQPTGSRPISQDFQNGSTSSALGRTYNHHHHHHHHHDARGYRKASQGASLSSSSAHDSVRSRHESGQQQQQHTQLLPPFKERPLTEEERELEHATLFRSLRGEYKPYEDEESQPDQHTAANDPFMPPELIAAIQTSMKNCAEYERQCAQLEVCFADHFLHIHSQPFT